MNREIKFRAWDKVNKKMLKAIDVWEFGVDDMLGYMWDGYSIEINNLILMQYTGLKANEVEIYDGDILKLDIDRTSMEGLINGNNIVVVEWHKHGIPQLVKRYLGKFPEEYGDYNFDLLTLGDEDNEIIGNIYENPELLEKND